MRDPTIETAATQALVGVTLASGGKTECVDCQRTIREGDAVGVYATRASDRPSFDPARVYCRNCRTDGVPHEASDATQVVVYATLAVTSDAASREARLTLRDPEAVAYADPSES